MCVAAVTGLFFFFIFPIVITWHKFSYLQPYRTDRILCLWWHFLVCQMCLFGKQIENKLYYMNLSNHFFFCHLYLYV